MNAYMNRVALQTFSYFDTGKNPSEEEKRYEDALVLKGVPKEKIRKYGFAFEGKKVLIG